MSKSTRSQPARPSKPRPDFPLYAHATGRWAKKVRRKLHYFGKIADDPKGERALNLWLEQKDRLLAGLPIEKTTVRVGGPTIADLGNVFYTHKKSSLLAGEITPHTFAEYEATTDRLVKVLGRDKPIDALVADDFRRLRDSIAKTWGPVRVANEIQRVRSVFKLGYESGLFDKPPRFGPGFKKPAAKVIRLARAERGLRMFEKDELLALLAVADPITKAITLLGVNCGFGNADVGHLPLKAVDLKGGWITYPRPKTGVDRRIPLWPETIEALRAVLAKRKAPENAEHKPLFFVSARGSTYQDDGRSYWIIENLRRALVKSKVMRPGLSYYALRHTFQTIGEGSRDLPAVRSVMGHAPAANDMSSVYRERVDDERLRAVVDHVRGWLFEKGDQK